MNSVDVHFSEKLSNNLDWNILLIHIDNTYPDKNQFKHSLWEKWLTYIQKTENEEVNEINAIEINSNKSNKLSKSGNNYKFDTGEYIADMAYESFLLSNNMHAAFIVSLWASIESNLNKVIDTYIALNSSSKLLDKKEYHGQFKFNEILKLFKKKPINLKISQLSKYSIINSVRVLNNSFKHSNGVYKPTKNYDKIHHKLLLACSIKENDKIDYTKLPIKEIIYDCGIFFRELTKNL